VIHAALVESVCGTSLIMFVNTLSSFGNGAAAILCNNKVYLNLGSIFDGISRHCFGEAGLPCIGIPTSLTLLAKWTTHN
jgi:hypothetical protein